MNECYTKEDPQTIRRMFDAIAKQYDRTNGILSLQMHRRWNQMLITKTLRTAQPSIFLDLCCGTGAIALRYLEEVETPIKAYLLDFSAGMLRCAKEQAKRKKIDRHSIDYLQADAEKIPLMDDTIDCATMAYGIRNVRDPALCLREVFRVLRPGGSFGILELTQPSHRVLRAAHHLYLRTVLPVVGKLITSNQEAYRYLCNSIHTFIPPAQLATLMKAAGFSNVQQHALLGGVATILTGTKKILNLRHDIV